MICSENSSGSAFAQKDAVALVSPIGRANGRPPSGSATPSSQSHSSDASGATIGDTSATAPFWANADPEEFSLQITAIVAAHANRVAAHDAAVGAHPWLGRATSRCLKALDGLEQAPSAYTLSFAIQLLDAVYERVDKAPERLAHLAAYVPDDGRLPVAGGLPDEALRPVDFAPDPGRPARDLLSDAVVAADLERLAGEQRADGGWAVDFESYSPAAALEWRGYATVRVLSLLRRNGLLDA